MARKNPASRVKSLGTNPLDYPSTMSLYERDSLVAESRLAKIRKAARKNGDGVRIGRMVIPHGVMGLYRVLGVSADGQKADIQHFNISTQQLMGDIVRGVPVNTLMVYEKD